MIPKECKRLAEVDFPIAVTGRYSLIEKATRLGTPHQLHLWWAWRPLAACRAVLLGLLLPDPCDPLCPDGFKAKARRALVKMPGKRGISDKDLQRDLFEFIGSFANWDHAGNDTWVSTSRELVLAAWNQDKPLVLDSFSGSGSIPLEALRLGCDAFAGELNSVACLILKVMLQDIQRRGGDLLDKLNESGTSLKVLANDTLSEVYPVDPDGAQPIAYIWARTVQCEQPNCGAEIPLLRGFWLAKKAGREKALQPRVSRPADNVPQVTFEIVRPDGDVPDGTVRRAKATCLCCHRVMHKDRVRSQLASQRGGSNVIFDAKGQRIGGALLVAVVTVKKGVTGRQYRRPERRDYAAVWKARNRLDRILADWEEADSKGTCPIPNEPTPAGGGSGAGRAFSLHKYGMKQFRDLFTERQNLALYEYSRVIREIKTKEEQELLALCVSKLAERNNSICDWMMDVECPGHLYTQQVIPAAWDFAEAVPISESSGSFGLVLKNTIENARSCYIRDTSIGDVSAADACDLPLPDQSCDIFFTDPPYYDAVPYSDLSDFFFVWLKRALPNHTLMRDPFDPQNSLTPKAREAVQDESRLVDSNPKDKHFFERTMSKAFAEGRRILKEDGIACIVFAHKTTEGWEALLSGLTRANWVITTSWPILTERSARKRAKDSAALATSVHLICRPRPANAAVGDWGEVLHELPKRVSRWMERLQTEGVRGADLVFACIGPALEIFSQYSRVETADGREVPLAEYLEKVWEVVGRSALEQVLGTAEAKAHNGVAGALEEDSRLTALFLWTLQSTTVEIDTNGNADAGNEAAHEEEEKPKKKKKPGFALVFDVARRFAQPLGIHLDNWEGRIIETEKGVVRLLAVSERAKQLFGEDGATAIASRLTREAQGDAQMVLFPDRNDEVPKMKGRRGRAGGRLSSESRGDGAVTTLDRVHAAMLLQANGQANGLRALIKTEQERGPDFLRLANALSALYPKDSEEKRLLDAMLLAVPR